MYYIKITEKPYKNKIYNTYFHVEIKCFKDVTYLTNILESILSDKNAKRKQRHTTNEGPDMYLNYLITNILE